MIGPMPMGGDKVKRAPPRMTSKRRPAPKPKAEPAEAQASLFEHFGLAPAVPSAELPEVVEGRPCPACGWLIREHDDASCPVCGASVEVDDTPESE